ncbi:hypothetical protein SteCoe_22658 [Stentor coeruleus]|uniref:START domain-containing protein n=1 Tax=Stentor coeruleus TaxID=5963 RepID=A0A1R2BLW5_9CILI|nr:hypothetical protein SteCoe_22658 [Stentor coeruleus]
MKVTRKTLFLVSGGVFVGAFVIYSYLKIRKSIQSKEPFSRPSPNPQQIHEESKSPLEEHKLSKLNPLDKFEEFEILMTEGTSEGWDIVKENPDFKVYKKITEFSPVAIIKATILVNDTTPDDALFAIWDGGFRREWDNVLQDFKVIEKYSENSDMIYFYAASPFPSIVSNREFIQHRKYRKDDNGILIVYWSAERDDIPVPEGWVRANTIISGYYIKSVEGGVELYFISQNDVKGKIPPKLINAVAPSKAMDWSRKFRRACALLKKRRLG